MRWADHPEKFVRPVRWIVALFGGEVVPITFAGVRAGRHSRGHRFAAPEPFEVTAFADWKDQLRERFVLADPVERRQRVVEELRRIEAETGLTVRPDEALLAEVTNLVEYPVGVHGSFDPAFLELPESVVVSAMRRHQRYFAMTRAAGNESRLANVFVTIAGTPARDPKVVAHGNERVLRARLADARFFFDEDRKLPLGEHAARLSKVVWVKGLGTIAEKVTRLERAATAMAGRFGVDPEKTARAAQLAKADLVTHLVGEFPDLQGLVGSAYALAAGEAPEVSRAIAEHHQPRNAAEPPAQGKVGALLAVADRMDTLVGCFSMGLAPTGSADPYALRRAALGLLQTLLGHKWHVPLRELAEAAALLYGKDEAKKAVAPVLEFITGRLRGIFIETLPADVVDAVLAADASDPVDALLRAEALSRFRAAPEFAALSTAIKRVGNILKNASPGQVVEEKLFEDPAERALWAETRRVGEAVAPSLSARAYGEVLSQLAGLGAPVDAFFTGVFVMAENPEVRANRLALLARVNALFLRIADFRLLA
jgi:glycyl-tRNA synthetase beta chain